MKKAKLQQLDCINVTEVHRQIADKTAWDRDLNAAMNLNQFVLLGGWTNSITLGSFNFANNQPIYKFAAF